MVIMLRGMITEFGFIRLPDVERAVGLKSTKIYDMVREKRFPAPRKIGRVSVWVRSEVADWVQAVVDGAPA